MKEYILVEKNQLKSLADKAFMLDIFEEEGISCWSGYMDVVDKCADSLENFPFENDLEEIKDLKDFNVTKYLLE